MQTLTDAQFVRREAIVYGSLLVVPLETGEDYTEPRESVGEATTFTAACRLLHKAGYRILRKGGTVMVYDKDEPSAKSYGRATLFVTVWP